MSYACFGVDPGKKGGIGIVYSHSDKSYFRECPRDIHGIGSLCRKIVDAHLDFQIRVCIEKVHAFKGSAAKSMFAFGENFGAWQTAFAVMEVPYNIIVPSVWQKGVYDSIPEKLKPKERSVHMAKRIFPHMEFETKRGRLLDGQADAMLIAEYCKRRTLYEH